MSRRDKLKIGAHARRNRQKDTVFTAYRVCVPRTLQLNIATIINMSLSVRLAPRYFLTIKSWTILTIQFVITKSKKRHATFRDRFWDVSCRRCTCVFPINIKVIKFRRTLFHTTNSGQHSLPPQSLNQSKRKEKSYYVINETYSTNPNLNNRE